MATLTLNGALAIIEMGIGDEKAAEKFGSKDLEINPNWTHSLAVHKNSDVPWNF